MIKEIQIDKSSLEIYPDFVRLTVYEKIKINIPILQFKKFCEWFLDEIKIKD